MSAFPCKPNRIPQARRPQRRDDNDGKRKKPRSVAAPPSPLRPHRRSGTRAIVDKENRATYRPRSVSSLLILFSAIMFGWFGWVSRRERERCRYLVPVRKAEAAVSVWCLELTKRGKGEARGAQEEVMARDIPGKEEAVGKVVHVQESETEESMRYVCVQGWKWGVTFGEGKFCRSSS